MPFVIFRLSRPLMALVQEWNGSETIATLAPGHVLRITSEPNHLGLVAVSDNDLDYRVFLVDLEKRSQRLAIDAA